MFDFMDFDKWLNTLDWSARPTITNYKNNILQSIKQAKTDEEILKICCGIFRCGYNQNFLDRLAEIKEKNNA